VRGCTGPTKVPGCWSSARLTSPVQGRKKLAVLLPVLQGDTWSQVLPTSLPTAAHLHVKGKTCNNSKPKYGEREPETALLKISQTGIVCRTICKLQYLQVGLGGSRGNKLWFEVKIEVKELIQHSPQHSQGPGGETSRTPGLCSSDSRTPEGQSWEKRNLFVWGERWTSKKSQYFENAEESHLPFTPAAN